MREKYFLKKATSSESDFVRRFFKDFVRRSRTVCSDTPRSAPNDFQTAPKSERKLRKRFEVAPSAFANAAKLLRGLRKRFEIVSRTSQPLRAVSKLPQTLRSHFWKPPQTLRSRFEAFANASKAQEIGVAVVSAFISKPRSGG